MTESFNSIRGLQSRMTLNICVANIRDELSRYAMREILESSGGLSEGFVITSELPFSPKSSKQFLRTGKPYSGRDNRVEFLNDYPEAKPKDEQKKTVSIFEARQRNEYYQTLYEGIIWENRSEKDLCELLDCKMNDLSYDARRMKNTLLQSGWHQHRFLSAVYDT